MTLLFFVSVTSGVIQTLGTCIQNTHKDRVSCINWNLELELLLILPQLMHSQWKPRKRRITGVQIKKVTIIRFYIISRSDEWTRMFTILVILWFYIWRLCDQTLAISVHYLGNRSMGGGGGGGCKKIKVVLNVLKYFLILKFLKSDNFFV